MQKIIFVLTYTEGDHWCNFYNDQHYKNIFNDPNYKIVFLDNGNQESISQWCKQTNSIHFVTENNIGTTGGYNWFIKVGALLKADRIIVMQGDIQIHNPICLSYLFQPPFRKKWKSDDFVYWPNSPRAWWTDEYLDADVGQFFSLNPNFFLTNDYLCDENYTVTHFESTDLYVRMTYTANLNKPNIHNLFTFFPDKEANYEELNDYSKEFFSIRSFTNKMGLHDKWFDYNYEYHRKKWLRDLPLTLEQGKIIRSNGGNLWLGPPWNDGSEESYKYSQLLLHRMALDVHRNINVGQLPYPVEWEINRFYNQFVKTGIIKIND